MAGGSRRRVSPKNTPKTKSLLIMIVVISGVSLFELIELFEFLELLRCRKVTEVRSGYNYEQIVNYTATEATLKS